MTTTPHNEGARVLVLDDDDDVRCLLLEGLARRGHRVSTAATAAEALMELDSEPHDVLLLDLRLAETDGLDVCRDVVARHPAVPVVVLTGYGSMETAIGALRAGAYDFAQKPVDLDALHMIVTRAVSLGRLRSEVARLRAEVEGSRRAEAGSGIVGESRAMRRMLSVVDRVADSDAVVLLTGQSGTGKELVARALHDRGPHADAPFVAVNCAAIPANLLESELFGHARGAFTDAKSARRGLFLEAEAGTLFLDEIGELPMDLQPKLLRVLQERRVRPVGDHAEYPFRARVVAATNRDLEEDVEQGCFREDLFYRVNVIRLQMPSLAERGNDVLLLAQHFLESIATRANKSVVGLTPEAASLLLDYSWPGNVRELQNAMERAVALAQHDKLTPGDLPDKIRQHRKDRVVLADTIEHMPTLAQLEQRYIDQVLNATGSNKTQAARVLGLDRRTLYRKLERLRRSESTVTPARHLPEGRVRGVA